MPDNNKYSFEEMTLDKSFKCFYVVPDYQREYVWEANDQVERLLADVTGAYESNPEKEYFIGTTVVYHRDGFNELIDGQQRTTTLFLILCAFRNIYKENDIKHSAIDRMICDVRMDAEGNEAESYRIQLQHEDTTKVLRQIAEEADIEPNDLSPSGRRLYDSYQSIKQELANLSREEIKKLFVYFNNKLKFIQISTPDINDALKIFETINDRGVGLTPLDLLKNLIFRQVPRRQFTSIKHKWQKLIATLQEADEKPLRFLRYFIMSNYPREKHAGTSQKDINLLREEEIYKWMVQDENKALCRYDKDPDAFIDLLVENAKAFVNFARGLDAKGNPNVYLKNIIELGGKTFRQHLIPLLAARRFKPEMFNMLARNIENYLFVNFLTQTQANTLVKTFAGWNVDLKQIKNAEQLRSFVTDRIRPDVDRKKGPFEARFLSLSENDLSRYRLKYILARIAQYLDDAHNGGGQPEALDHYCNPKTEIEHILPQKPPSPQEKYEYEDYGRSKSMLGNLTLIERSMNAVIKNGPYENKLQEYGKSPFYLTSSLAGLHEIGSNSSVAKINGSLMAFSQWNQDAIAQRQQMLYSLACVIWRIDGTDQLFSTPPPPDEGSAAWRLSVTMPDGTVIENQRASATFAEAIRAIGLEKVRKLHLAICGVPIVGREKSDKYNQTDAGDGWLVMTHCDTNTKARCLHRIADKLHVKLKVSVTKKPKKPE